MQAEDVALMRVMLMANMGFPLAEEHKKIIDALPVGWKLHPSHPLKEVTQKMDWACDGCSARGYDQVKHFRCCMGCNFDLCNKCYTGVENDKVEASPLPELIRPGPPEVTGLPFRDEYDETKTTFWDDFRKPYVGQILFSSKPIERFVQDPSDLKTRFEDGGEIHACAVWPRALRNYPIAHAPGKADVPVYGPKFILKDGVGNMNLHGLQLFVYVSVDGKPVGRDLKWNEEVISGPLLMRTELGPNPPGGSSSGAKNDEAYRKYSENFSPDTVDYWAMNQTKTFGLFMKRYYLSDNWEQGIPLFIKTLAQLSPGEHKVEVDFRFRLVVNEETCAVWKSLELLPASECFPEKGPTQISHPIARGEFTYVVTPESAAAAAVTANPLPERSTQLDPTEADRLEQLLFEVMKESPEWGKRTTQVERVLKVVIAGAGWRQLQKEHPKDAVRYMLDFNACVYRSPLDGWPEESLTTFGLGAVSYSNTPTNRNDIIRISVGGNRELDADLVPESAFAEVGVRRCPAAMRRGVAK